MSNLGKDGGPGEPLKTAPKKRLTLTPKAMRQYALGLLVAYVLVFIAVCEVTGYPKGANEVGDAFGVMNAVVSGIALLAVIYTVVQQQQMIDDQHEELQKQNHYLSRQAIQSQFFQMLQSWQQSAHGSRLTVADAYDYVGKSPPIERQGRQAFSSIAVELSYKMNPLIERYEVERLRVILLSMTRRRYREVFDSNADILGHYFRLLYHIIRFVDRQHGLSVSEKRDYIRIVRAHLSPPELFLMFFNGLSEYGDKMYPYIEKYDLLQNMNYEQIAAKELFLYYPRLFCRLKVKKGFFPPDAYYLNATPVYLVKMGGTAYRKLWKDAEYFDPEQAMPNPSS